MKHFYFSYLLSAALLLLALSGWAQTPKQETFEYQEGDTTYVMQKYYLVLLKRGPNRSQDSLEAAKIQTGHLAHIEKMAQEGYVALAGPFEGEQDLRGVLVYTNVSGKEEVIKLQSEDPAVKAGRLVVEVLPWWAAKGSVLP